MSIRNAIRQLQKLEPGVDYAAVFERALSQAELQQLMDLCNKARLRVFVLNGAKIVPVQQLGLVLTPEQVAALEPSPGETPA